MISININLLWIIATTLFALAIGTGIRLIAIQPAAPEIAAQRIASLKVWWILALLWSGAAILGKWGVAILLVTGSVLGMLEYLRLIGSPTKLGRLSIGCLLMVGGVHYVLIMTGNGETARWSIPVALLLLLGTIRSAVGNTTGFIRITAGMYWGFLLLVFGLSHGLFLFEFESDHEPWVGRSGWFLFLILLTEVNDIMQAIAGRKFGKYHITPVVSPHKTLEGLLGGMVCTVILAVLLAPWLTSLTWEKNRAEAMLVSALAGLLISISGFLGDINMSAIKRDAGVKDGSNLLPGMGGMIDRVDSLVFTSPTFYYFIVFLHSPTWFRH